MPKQYWINSGIWFGKDLIPTGFRYATTPFIFSSSNGEFNLMITVRDLENRSLPISAPFNSIADLNGPLAFSEPLLSIGPPGSFDENGIMACQVINTGDRTLLFYIGWNLGISVPFRNSIGMAELVAGKWEKSFPGPILDRNRLDSCFVASPFVIQEADHFKLYYLSCKSWEKDEAGKLTHKYNLSYARSTDLVTFEITGHTVIDFKNEYEIAISRPCVIHEHGIYKMWYSFRGSKGNPYYRIGYAESSNGTDWKRLDNKLSIQTKGHGFDDVMQCYPFVFDYLGERYMLYNGNGYGQSGFGVLKLDK